MTHDTADLLNALADGATDLSAGNGWPDGVDRLLERLGRAAGATRIWICKRLAEDDRHIVWDYVREWSSEPRYAQLGNEDMFMFRTDLTDPDYARIAAERRAGHPHLIYAEDLEGDWGQKMTANGVYSSLTAPIIVEGDWWGTLGIDDCQNARSPNASDMHAIRAAANLIGASIVHQRLHDKRGQFELVLHATDAGYWHYDIQSQHFWWSPQLLKLAGLNSNLENLPLRRIIAKIHPDDRHTLLREMRQAASGQADRIRLELRIGDAQDGYVWLEILGYLRRDTLGAPDRLAGIGIDIRARKREEMQLREQADVDSLTGALNRRAFDCAAELALEHSVDADSQISLLLLDLDHFKLVNDSHGHHVGDHALREVADLCRSSLRDGDVFGRIGGEEFAVILPGACRDTASQIAERIRTRIQNNQIDTLTGTLRLTVSIGVSHCGDEHSLSLPDMLKRADGALYRAKRMGRNQLQVAA